MKSLAGKPRSTRRLQLVGRLAEDIGAKFVARDFAAGRLLYRQAAFNRHFSPLSPPADRSASDAQLGGKRALCTEQIDESIDGKAGGWAGGFHADI